MNPKLNKDHQLFGTTWNQPCIKSRAYSKRSLSLFTGTCHHVVEYDTFIHFLNWCEQNVVHDLLQNYKIVICSTTPSSCFCHEKIEIHKWLGHVIIIKTAASCNCDSKVMQQSCSMSGNIAMIYCESLSFALDFQPHKKCCFIDLVWRYFLFLALLQWRSSSRVHEW